MLYKNNTKNQKIVYKNNKNGNSFHYYNKVSTFLSPEIQNPNFLTSKISS